MKRTPLLFVILALAVFSVSCTTTTTTQLLPDGTKVVVVAKSSDPVAIKAALDAASIIAPVVEKLAIEQAAKQDNPSNK